MTLGNFVKGAFDGYAFGENVKDKKRRTKNEEEDRTRRHKVEDLKLGAWQEDRAHTVSERKRSVRLRNEEEAMYADAYDDAQESYTTRNATKPEPAEEPAPLLMPRRPGAAQNTPPVSAGVGRSVAPDAPRNSPQVMQAPVPDTAPNVNQPADLPPPSFAQDPEVVAAAEAMGLTPEAVWMETPPETRRMYAQRPAAPAGAVTPPAPGPHAQMMPDTGYPAAFTDNQSVQDAVASGVPIEKIWESMPQGTKDRMMSPYQNSTVQAQTIAPQQRGRSVMDAMPSAPSPEMTAPSMPARPASMQQPAAPQQPAAAPIDPQTATTEQIAAQDKDPNIEAAESAVAAQPRTVLKPGQKIDGAKRKKATDSFMDHYMKVAVPQIRDSYLKTGNIEKAQAFDNWVETREAKAIQKDFGELTFTLAIGDFDNAMDSIEKMYESVNDGYDLVREDSGFKYDEQGNPVAAKFVIRDSETGEVFTQEVQGQGDLASQLLGLLNPQGAFDYLLKRQEAAIKYEQDRAKAASKTVIDRDELMNEIKRLTDDEIDRQEASQYGGPPHVPMTPEEIERKALENLRKADALTGGRSYSPAAAAVPDWQR